MPASGRIAIIIFFVLLVSLIAFSSPCAAETTVTVRMTIGGVIGGGVGLCLYFFYSFESGFLPKEIMPALLNIRKGKAVLGIPEMEFEESVPEIYPRKPVESYFFRLFRWEF